MLLLLSSYSAYIDLLQRLLFFGLFSWSCAIRIQRDPIIVRQTIGPVVWPLDFSLLSLSNKISFSIKGKFSKEDPANGATSPPSQNVSSSQSEVPSKQASTEEEPWLSSPKDTIFPETIPEESSSTEEEHVVGKSTLLTKYNILYLHHSRFSLCFNNP